MTRRSAKRIGSGVLIIFALAQFIPVDRSNPPLEPSQTIFAAEPMPPDVRAIFENSCVQCHSNQVRWPWYSHLAPVSWVIAHDVHQGRKQLNFSEWAAYPARKKEDKRQEICEQVANGDMPESKYALLHRRAHLTPEQRDAVCAWSQTP
jgi:hypothetical protein